MDASYDTPAMLPPDGLQSNFVNPPDSYAWTLGIGVTGMTIMTIAMSIRTYTKVFILKEFRHEDYAALLALVGFLAWCTVYIYLASVGFTRDLWNVRAIDMPHYLYLLNVFEIFYAPSMLFAKYFIIIQLKRVFCPPGRRTAVWWALYTLVAATVIYYISCFFSFIFQCVPRERIWNPTLDGTCINKYDAVLFAGIINLVLDLSILIVPIWAVWHLRMALKRKLGVIAIFTMGFVTCGFAAGGVAYRVPLTSDHNFTRASSKVGLWAMAELTGTIVIGSMPVMPRFYETKLAPMFSSTSQSFQEVFPFISRTKHGSRKASTAIPGSPSFSAITLRGDSESSRSTNIKSSYNRIELTSLPTRNMV